MIPIILYSQAVMQAHGRFRFLTVSSGEAYMQPHLDGWQKYRILFISRRRADKSGKAGLSVAAFGNAARLHGRIGMKRSKRIRIVAVLAVIGLLAAFSYFFISAYGDPISKAIAARQVREYVAETYPEWDFVVEKALYNAKFSTYQCRVWSQSVKDATFTVSWKNGRIWSDHYATDVKGRYATYRRLLDEMDEEMEALISSKYPHAADLVIVDMDKGDMSTLALDVQAGIHTPPLPLSLTVWVQEEGELSYNVLTERLLELKALMDREGIPVQWYSLLLERPRDAQGQKRSPELDVRVDDVPSSMLEDEEGLAAALEQHQAQREAELEEGKR